MTLFESELDISENALLTYLSGEVNLNPIRFKEVFSLYESLNAAVFDDFNKFDKRKNKWLEKWKGFDKTKFDKMMESLQVNEISVLTIFDENYPEKLKILDDYPLVLYYQGDLSLFDKKEVITVVGSRNYTRYAEILLNKTLKPTCQAGVGVVSGLALGIDGLSHQVALEGGSFTIAVIGSGLDDKSFYPSSNLGLKKQIIEQGGLVLSEYPPGFEATRFTFPRRNRILSALSELTWIVQAAKKSGTLITASLSRDLGKTVATTPGSVFEATLAGNLELIKDGASLITEPEDIFMLLGLKAYPEIVTERKIEFGSENEKKVYNILSLTPRLAEDVAGELDMKMTEINGVLTMLELSGLATSLGENQWIRG